jgi:hypothetical protein
VRGELHIAIHSIIYTLDSVCVVYRELRICVRVSLKDLESEREQILTERSLDVLVDNAVDDTQIHEFERCALLAAIENGFVLHIEVVLGFLLACYRNKKGNSRRSCPGIVDARVRRHVHRRRDRSDLLLISIPRHERVAGWLLTSVRFGPQVELSGLDFGIELWQQAEESLHDFPGRSSGKVRGI